MPLLTIKELVITYMMEELVPDETYIDNKIIEIMYIVQDDSGLSDADVEIEANYAPKERIVIAKYTAYEYLKRILKSNSVTIKDVDGNITTLEFSKRLKKAKADVVETEFEYSDSKASAGYSFKAKATEIMEMCLEELCGLAREIGWGLGICRELDAKYNQNRNCGCKSITIVPRFSKSC